MPDNALLFQPHAMAEIAFLEADPADWRDTLKQFVKDVRTHLAASGLPAVTLSGIDLHREATLSIVHPVEGPWNMGLHVSTPDVIVQDDTVRFCETAFRGRPDAHAHHNPAKLVRGLAWQRFVDALTQLTAGPFNGRLQLIGQQS